MLFLWLVVLQLVVFAVLVFFLRLIFSRNVSTATAHLHELNADYTQKLDEAKKRQAEADKYYDDLVTKAKADAERTKVQILTEMRETQAVMLGEARRQSEDILSQANNARAEMLAELQERIEVRSTEKGAEMLSSVLPELITKQLHEAWVSDLLKNGLGDLSRMNLPADVKEILVKSAHPLSAEHRAALQKKIKDAVKRELPVTAEVDPSLVAGIVVTVGSVVIDGSLRLKIKDFVRHAQNSARH